MNPASYIPQADPASKVNDYGVRGESDSGLFQKLTSAFEISCG
jgi:hypothetical protein